MGLWNQNGADRQSQSFKDRMASPTHDQLERHAFYVLGLTFIRSPIRIRWPNMNGRILTILLDTLFEFLECLLVAPIFTPVRSNHVHDLRRINLQLMSTRENALHDLCALNVKHLAGV